MPEIPDKQWFKIGEAARIVGVRPSVLRFWETEFEALRPGKSRSGQRVYSRKMVERLLEVRHLLYDRGFTIAGARRHLRGAGEREASGPEHLDEVLREVEKEVRDLLRLVEE